jgi:hypothetical protein
MENALARKLKQAPEGYLIIGVDLIYESSVVVKPLVLYFLLNATLCYPF